MLMRAFFVGNNDRYNAALANQEDRGVPSTGTDQCSRNGGISVLLRGLEVVSERQEERDNWTSKEPMVQ